MKIDLVIGLVGSAIMIGSVFFIGGDTKHELILSFVPYMFGLGMWGSSFFMDGFQEESV